MTGNDDSSLKASREACRLSELRLNQQAAIALAADQRAMNFCGLVIISATVLLGISFQNPGNILVLLSSVLFFASAIGAAYSCAPVDFYPSGGHYSDLKDFFVIPSSEGSLLELLGKRNDDRLDKNNKHLKRASRIFIISQFLALSGIFFATSGLWIEHIDRPMAPQSSAVGTNSQ